MPARFGLFRNLSGFIRKIFRSSLSLAGGLSLGLCLLMAPPVLAQSPDGAKGDGGPSNSEEKTPEKASVKTGPKDIILTVKIEGVISLSTVEKLNQAIERAEAENARALFVFLNTPGGFMVSMDKMCQNILNSKVPVVTYVHPLGAYAGSAGVYIMYASHLAVMSPTTNIGSATPVMSGGGGEDGKKGDDRIPETAGTDDAKNLKRKLFNHARAQIRSFSQFHGRNAEFGERTITHAENLTAREALKLDAIEMIVESPEMLIEQAHGRRVRMAGGYQLLNLKGARLVDVEGDFRLSFIEFLSNPAVIQLLMMFGVLGIWIEIQYPGGIFPGAVGAICLLLGLYGMQNLPGNYAGVALIILGAVFFILEIKVISYGLLSLGGTACFIVGSLLLVPSGEEFIWQSVLLALGTSLTVALIMGILVIKAAQVMRTAPVTGVEILEQELGVAQTEINENSGHVFIHSELWSARSFNSGEVIAKGTVVQVRERDGMTMKVEPAPEGAESGERPAHEY